MSIFRNWRIGVQVSLVVLVILILIVTIVSAFAIDEFSKLNDEQAVEQAVKGVGGLKQMIAASQEEASDTAALISINPLIIDAVSGNNRNALSSAVEQIAAVAGARLLTFTDARGTVLYRAHQPDNHGDSLAGQPDVQQAISGQPAAVITGEGTTALRINASTPVIGNGGNIVGVVSVGVDLADSVVLDDLKKTFLTEMTLFAGDVRLATTITKDGERVLGTQLDSRIAGVVIGQAQPYSGVAQILGGTYITHYEPLTDSTGAVIGVLFAGQPIETFNNVRDRLILLITLIAIVAIAVFSLIMDLIVRRSVSRPLKSITDAANQLALGNINLTISDTGKVKSKNEIDILKHGFRAMIDNIRDNANAAGQIAVGSLDVELSPKSEQDILSHSLIQVRQVLLSLTEETRKLTASTVAGHLSVRGDSDRFQGGYRDIIEGFNQTLDAAIAPIQESAAVLNEMAAGRLSQRMSGDYQGEHAAIKNALNSTIDTLTSYVGEISHVLTEMAHSNLNIVIEKDYLGDFAPIKSALNLIVDSFNKIFNDMSTVAEQVESGSQHMADGSQMLSQGATEQASSLEQLTDEISAIAQQTQGNAENARHANTLALEAHTNAQAGNRRMGELQLAMNEISKSSGNIATIIKVIDDIAFQTNILALNAAVEAARAGQHGKGFAVVAEEVRNLASKSAEAARETTSLVETTIRKTTAGSVLADDTVREFGQIVESVAQTADLIGAITAASTEQAESIAKVNQGISQVSAVVQSNSATAEESAATSEELSGQSALLKELISQFSLRA